MGNAVGIMGIFCLISWPIYGHVVTVKLRDTKKAYAELKVKYKTALESQVMYENLAKDCQKELNQLGGVW